IATAVRGQGMFNIDFTGGTLVTIRLNEADPTVKALSDSRRAEFVREKASILPDVTVESLRVSNDKSLTRFNIRTTDDKQENVRKRILEAFGPSLARVEMTAEEGKSISAPAGGEAAAGDAAPRFAGGREYLLKFNTTAFNTTQSPAQFVSAEYVKILNDAKITNPESRFEIKEAPKPAEGAPAAGSTSAEGAAAAGSTPAGLGLILRTDLE